MTMYVRGFIKFDDTVRKILSDNLPIDHGVLEALRRDDNAGLTVDLEEFEYDTVGGDELDEFGYVDVETLKIMRQHLKELLKSDNEDVVEEAEEFNEALNKLEKLLPIFGGMLDVYNDEE